MKKQKKLVHADRGASAEYAFASRCLLKGFHVSWPSSHLCPYDMIVDNGYEIKKIQVKGVFKKENGKQAYKFNIENNSGKYQEHQVDLFVLYVHPLERFFIVPFEEGNKTTRVYLDRDNDVDKYAEAWDLL